MRIKDENLDFFIREVKSKFEEKLKKIILFGSRARGDFLSESDYDLLLIFEEVTPEIRDFISELEGKMLLSRGILFSTFVFTPQELEEREFEPFIMNVQKEGMAIE